MKSDPAVSRPMSESRKTVGRILDAAQQVLITRGYAGFTMRRVARSSGISPGNLTYHFPRKTLLLRALIIRLMESYARQFDNILSGPDLPVQQEVETLVHWLLMENVAEETVHISREIWAMALHDEVIRSTADDFYDELMEQLVNLLLRSRPHADRAAIQEIVQFLVLLSEGTAVLFGTRRERAIPVERMIEVAGRLLKSLEPDQRAPDGKDEAAPPGG